MNIRKANESDATAMGHVLVDSYRSAHQDQIPEQLIVNRSYEESGRNWARSLREINAVTDSSVCIYLAEEDNGHIVGIAMGGPDNREAPSNAGEIYVLYLLPSYQRRGTGRRLVETVSVWLARHNMSSLIIRVLAVNAPAHRFYEALGGQLVPAQPHEEEGILLDQVGYWWADINVLVRGV